MIPALERLVRLQQAETELHEKDARLAEVPKLKATVEQRLTDERGKLDAAKAALAETQRLRRQFEGTLQELEAKRSKYKGQLMEVKTNKEYSAMLHEIEAVEREIREREDAILAEMEKAETITVEIRAEEAIFKQVEETHHTEVRSLEVLAAELSGEVDRLSAERDQVAATVPEDALLLYRRIARLRGTAVAEAKDGMCLQCHVKLRLQFFADLKRNETIEQCPACQRILYVAPAAAVVAP